MNSSITRTPHPCLLAIVFVLGLAALIAAMFCGLAELYPMGFQYGPSAEYLAGQVDRKKPEEIVAECVDALRKTSKHNLGIIKRMSQGSKELRYFSTVVMSPLCR